MKPVLSNTKPLVGKMRKIIKDADKAKTLIHGKLIGKLKSVKTDNDSFTAPVCTRPGRCAMGELLFRAGYTNDTLRNMNVNGEWDSRIYCKLWDSYKIDNVDVRTIINGNDRAALISETGESVSKALTKIAKRTKRVNPYLNRISAEGEVMGPEPTKEEMKVLKKFNVVDEVYREIF